MKTHLFDFELPPDRIALRPCEPRDAARLLVVEPPADACDPPQGPRIHDHTIGALPTLLRAGDVLVVNDTRVIPAAMKGVRLRSDLRANVSFNLVKRLDDNTWRALARPAKKLLPGDTVRFGNVNHTASTEQLNATVASKGDAGSVDLEFNVAGVGLDAAITALGEMPIPPYIAAKRDADTADRANYQTIFAANDGAVAAPTAGLHFTAPLLAQLDDLGVERHTVTLHVGAGTFLPVKADDTDDHEMHAEWGEITPATAKTLNAARAQGRRIIAIGTTSLRLLESAARADGTIAPFCDDTAIFITPGYDFKVVDALVTNFHLPRSTLFMLVSAFAGLDTMLAAYDHAVKNGYRFYSYGDANFLIRR